MAKILQLLRGNTTKNLAYTGLEGEVTVDTDKKTLRVHDGTTAGGNLLVGMNTTFTITDSYSENTSSAVTQNSDGAVKLVLPASVKFSTIDSVSDKRLKDNIEEYSSGNLDNLGCYVYNFKDESQKHIGLIAQEVQAEFPECVHSDSKGFLSVEYSGICAILLREIKALKQTVKALQDELESKGE